jgi:hypothetical protein
MLRTRLGFKVNPSVIGNQAAERSDFWVTGYRKFVFKNSPTLNLPSDILCL